MNKACKALICFGLAFSTHITAQQIETAEQQLKAKLANFTSFSAEFRQVVKDAFGEELQTAEGKLFLQRPNFLHWQSLPPNELTLIADGNAVWYVDPFAEQVIAMNQQDAAADHPIMLLADVNAPQWDKYTATLTSDEQYLLTANTPQSDVTSMMVAFENGQLSEIVISDNMEQVNQLKFIEPVSNIELPPDLFIFEVPDGFDLDDQRKDVEQ